MSVAETIIFMWAVEVLQTEHIDNDKVHYCSVDFDSLSSMRFDMAFDDTLRDGSSSGKLTAHANSCY